MTHRDPVKRATINHIKNSNWYRGKVYSEEKLRGKMSGILKPGEVGQTRGHWFKKIFS